MQKNIFSYTASSGTYPEYLSINELDDGRITVTLRNPASRGEDDLLCGSVAMLVLPVEELHALAAALNTYCHPQSCDTDEIPPENLVMQCMQSKNYELTAENLIVSAPVPEEARTA